ncbi:MAG: type III-A CRISPR-associated RAMP protein Csm5 [Prevotellaceae bacterium]|jgi:CRISPR-associated protein Csm5|nr:type III-A CRISPR-associated RAMP protein Csm5 [Prevotellaceae bacterium]
MNEKTKLKITTITPVTIGSGVELSPYADYIVDDNQICFIDKKRMQDKILAKGDQYLDNYIYGVANGIDNNRSEFDLKGFLLNNKIVEDINEAISSRCPFTTSTPDSKLPIKGMIKSPLSEPYFPGSSIKGALKTVLMYNWLKTNRKANETIEKVINGGNFNWLEKEFEYRELQEGKTIPNTIRQVTDSKLLPKEANVVVDCYRKMPIRFECIAKNNTSEFELTLEDYKWTDLAKQANKYVTDVLERKFELIEKDENLTRYYNHLADFEEKIIETNDDTAYIRIGFGKGYYLNSLGIAIYDYVSQKGKEDLFDKFEKFVNDNFARKDKYGNKQQIDLEKFPMTRLFVSKTQEPLGWVKIEKQDC